MRLLLGIIIFVLVVGSIYADYRWKRWMAAQREARERTSSHSDGQG